MSCGRDNCGEDGDNPFSFRKFLSQGKSPEINRMQNQIADVSVISSNGSESCISVSSLKTPGSSLDTDSDFSHELPDFIQGHLDQVTVNNVIDDVQSSFNSTQNSIDRTYCRNDIFSSSPNNNHLETSATSYSDTFATESYEENESASRLTEETACSLPDFISGTLQSDSVVASSCFEDSANSAHTQSLLADEVCMLREENMFLHKQLEEATVNSEHQLSRIMELEDKLNELCDKETQETAALEKMVQQVEFNLQVTTERAIKAEVQVSKLKQEMKLLQAQLKSMAKENQKLNSANAIVERDTIMEKADSIASQIKTAADNAEQPLRTLMEGLDHLRFLSSLIGDIGKIQEAD